MQKRGLVVLLGASAALAVAGLLIAVRARVPGTISEILFRKHQVIAGEVRAGERFQRDFGPNFIFTLSPIDTGWLIEVRERGASLDLSRLTPPFHGVPNPREVCGWHFRNLASTAPNDGSVNAPGEIREFCFWPGAKAGDLPTPDNVQSAFRFGRGTLEVLDHELTDPVPWKQASFARLSFRVDLSWPREYRPPPGHR